MDNFMLLELLSRKYPGFRAWLAQRFTGLIVAIYSVVLVVRLICVQPNSFETWQRVFQPWWMRVLSILFWLSLSMHAWLGIRDVLKDYVPNIAVRGVAIKVVIILLWAYLVWAMWLFTAFFY